MRDHAHEPHERDRKPVCYGSEKQPVLCRLLAFRRKGALPHLRAREREHEVGDDIPYDRAVDVGRRQLRRKIAEKGGRPAELYKGGAGDEDVHEQNQHDELKHVRVDHAEQTGGGGVNDEHRAGDKSAHLIGDADLPAEHVDDSRRRRDLGRDGPHHGEGDQRAERDLGGFAEAPFKKVGDGGDVKARADGGYTSGKAGKNQHPQKIGNRRHNGLEAAGIGDARPSHQTAAADDGGADGRHEHQWAEGTSAEIIVIRVLDFFDDNKADHDHCNKICADNGKVDCVQLAMVHSAYSFPDRRSRRFLFCAAEEAGNCLPRVVRADKNDLVAAVQLRVGAG